MKTGTDLEQAGDPTVEFGSAGRGPDDARQDFQERRLAGPVPPDDADALAACHLEAHVVERPERLVLAAVAGGGGTSQQALERAKPTVDRPAAILAAGVLLRD